MLWNGGKSLVQKELQAVVVHPNQERAPVTNGLNKPNQLLLVSCQFCVARGYLPAEESDRASSLVKHGVEAGPRSVTLRDELGVERWQLKHRGRCQRLL